MHGLIQSRPVGPGPSSRHRIPNQRGITHISTMVRTDCHTFLFPPLTSAKNPVFTKNCLPKSSIFPHCPKFWKFFTQRPQIGWNLRKRYPNAPYFYGFCHYKTPYFLPCMHMFERNVAPSNTVCRSWKILYS